MITRLAVGGSGIWIRRLAVRHKTMPCASINDWLKEFARALHLLLAIRYGDGDPRVILAVKAIDRTTDVLDAIGRLGRPAVEDKHRLQICPVARGNGGL